MSESDLPEYAYLHQNKKRGASRMHLGVHLGCTSFYFDLQFERNTVASLFKKLLYRFSFNVPFLELQKSLFYMKISTLNWGFSALRMKRLQ
jgi:hypothetical protein